MLVAPLPPGVLTFPALSSLVAGSALSDTSAKEDSHGNVNVPGAKAATKMAATPGHGAEKKGKPETADKGAGSTIKGK